MVLFPHVVRTLDDGIHYFLSSGLQRSPILSAFTPIASAMLVLGDITALIGSWLRREIMNTFWTALAAFGGATVGTILVEWYRQLNRLRLAAIDKRLETHQEAFALCRRLTVASIQCDYYVAKKRELKAGAEAEVDGMPEARENMDKIVHECFRWFDTHCLYLDIESRQAFKTAYEAALRGYLLPTQKLETEPMVTGLVVLGMLHTIHTPTEDQRKQIKDACDVIAKAAGLPPLAYNITTDKLWTRSGEKERD